MMTMTALMTMMMRGCLYNWSNNKLAAAPSKRRRVLLHVCPAIGRHTRACDETSTFPAAGRRSTPGVNAQVLGQAGSCARAMQSMAWQPRLSGAAGAKQPESELLRPHHIHQGGHSAFDGRMHSPSARQMRPSDAASTKASHVLEAVSPQPREPGWDGWRVYFHDGYQLPYFHHAASNSTQWERPACVPPDAEPESTFANGSLSTRSEAAEPELGFSPAADDIASAIVTARADDSREFMTDTEARLVRYSRNEADTAVERAVAVLRRGSDGEVTEMQSMVSAHAAMSQAGAASGVLPAASAIRFFDHQFDASYGIDLPPRSARFSSSRDAAGSGASPVARDSFNTFKEAAMERARLQRRAPDDRVHTAAARIQGLFRMVQSVQKVKFCRQQRELATRRRRAEACVDRERLRTKLDEELQEFELSRMRHRQMGAMNVVDALLQQQRGAMRASAKQSQTDRRLQRVLTGFRAVLRRHHHKRGKLVFEELRNRAAEVIQQAMRKWRNASRFIGSVQMRQRIAQHRAMLGAEAAANAEARRIAAVLAEEARATAAAEAYLAFGATEEDRVRYATASRIQRAFRRRPSQLAKQVEADLRRNGRMVCTRKRLVRLFQSLQKDKTSASLTRQEWLKQTSGTAAGGVTASTRDLLSMQEAAGPAPEAASGATATSGGPPRAPSLGESKWKMALKASLAAKGVPPTLRSLSGFASKRLHRASSSIQVDPSLMHETRRRSTISMQTSAKIFNCIDGDNSHTIEADEFVQFFMGPDLEPEMLRWVTDAVIAMEAPDRNRESRALQISKRIKRAVAPSCQAAWRWRMSIAAGRFYDTCPDVGPRGMTAVEFSGAMRATQGRSTLSPDEARQLFMEMDDDASGTMDRNEFIEGVTNPKFESLQDWLLEHFAQGTRTQWAIVDHDALSKRPLL